MKERLLVGGCCDGRRVTTTLPRLNKDNRPRFHALTDELSATFESDTYLDHRCDVGNGEVVIYAVEGMTFREIMERLIERYPATT